MKNGISEEKAYQEALDYVEILEDKAYNNLKHFLSQLHNDGKSVKKPWSSDTVSYTHLTLPTNREV